MQNHRRTPIIRLGMLVTLVFFMAFMTMDAESAEEAHKASYSFGVVPQQSASKIVRLWTPILDYLGRKSGVRLEISTAKDIPEFERRLAEGIYDVAYMNPYHYTVFHEKPGYQAVAKQRDKRIRGIFVAKNDSPIQTLEDLRGKRLAFPSPAAFAASILPRGELGKQGIAFTPVYVSSHDSVYMTVARGFFPAGGGVVRTLNNTDPSVRSQLRVLWKTAPYTSHAIAVHPRVPNSMVAALRKAMVAMGEDPEGAALLNAINFKNGIEPAHNADWDDVRALNITMLEQLKGQE